jgi:hypothetical protein
MLRRVVSQKLIDVLEVITASTTLAIGRAMEAVSTSETSIDFCETTRRSIPEYSHVYTRRRENLKSHKT